MEAQLLEHSLFNNTHIAAVTARVSRQYIVIEKEYMFYRKHIQVRVARTFQIFVVRPTCAKSFFIFCNLLAPQGDTAGRDPELTLQMKNLYSFLIMVRMAS